MVKVERRLVEGRSEMVDVGKERESGLALGAAEGFRVWWIDKHSDAI